jgi:HEAT repeat protein
MIVPLLGERARSYCLFVPLVVSSFAQFGCLQEAPAPSVERGTAVLIALLQDTDADIRRTAVESLGKIGDRSALSAVSPLLADPLPAIRAAAAQAVGRMAAPDDQSAIAALAHSLGDVDQSVRQAAALAIGEIEPSPRQLPSLAERLQASDVELRRTAVRALMLLDAGQVVEWLLPLLDDPDAEVRQGAVAALGLSGDARAATALGKRLMQDPSPSVRAEAAYHLGELSEKDTRTMLRAAVEKERDRGVRRWIEAELKALRAND